MTEEQRGDDVAAQVHRGRFRTLSGRSEDAGGNVGSVSPTVRIPIAAAGGRPPILAVTAAFLTITAVPTLVVTLATRGLVRPPGYEYLDGPAAFYARGVEVS
jgi:hypothetical protein